MSSTKTWQEARKKDLVLVYNMRKRTRKKQRARRATRGRR